jgi:hypothetical protein
MPEYGNSLPHDEEPDPEPITPRGVEPGKGFEYLGHMLIGYTNSRVQHVDAHAVLKTTATQKYLSTRLCVFYRIANQIAKSGTEKKDIAHDLGGGGYQANPNSLLLGGPFGLSAGFSQQRPESDWRSLDVPGMFAETKGL